MVIDVLWYRRHLLHSMKNILQMRTCCTFKRRVTDRLYSLVKTTNLLAVIFSEDYTKLLYSEVKTTDLMYSLMKTTDLLYFAL